MGTAGTFLGDLRTVLRGRDFRRLFLTRLVSQAADGAFQVGLAGVVLFSPERAATAGQVAMVFTVALAPYTVLGPFTGVMLDHWRRRQVLVVANAVRALVVVGTAVLAWHGVVGAPLYLAVLVSMSVNRFFLAGIGASLPRVVAAEELVMANSVSPTSGAVVGLLGGVLGYSVRALAGPGHVTDGLIVLLAATGYAGAALLAARIGVDLLGPGRQSRLPWSGVGEAARGVGGDLAGALRHLRARRAPAAALAVTVAVRFGYGVALLMTLLMCRNLLTPRGHTGAGLGLLTLVLAATAGGFALAAVLTPAVTQRLSPRSWVVVCVAGMALLDVTLLVGISVPGMLAAAVLLGLLTQSSKICVDAIVQAGVDDAFRGRVFAVYDVLFNAAFILAAAVAAAVLPERGYSRAALVGLAVLHAVTALGYGRAGAAAGERREGRPEPGVGGGGPRRVGPGGASAPPRRR